MKIQLIIVFLIIIIFRWQDYGQSCTPEDSHCRALSRDRRARLGNPCCDTIWWRPCGPYEFSCPCCEPNEVEIILKHKIFYTDWRLWSKLKTFLPMKREKFYTKLLSDFIFGSGSSSNLVKVSRCIFGTQKSFFTKNPSVLTFKNFFKTPLDVPSKFKIWNKLFYYR